MLFLRCRPQLGQERCVCSSDWRAPIFVLQGHQITVVPIDDRSPGLVQDEQRTQVVPRAVGIDGQVDERIESAISDRADVEGSGAVTPELSPSEVRGRKPRHRNERVREHRSGSGLNRGVVAEGSPTTDRVPARARRLVDHERCHRSVGIDGAEACPEPRQPSRRIRRAVDRVDNDNDRPIVIGDTGLLAQNTEPFRTQPLNPQSSWR